MPGGCIAFIGTVHWSHKSAHNAVRPTIILGADAEPIAVAIYKHGSPLLVLPDAVIGPLICPCVAASCAMIAFPDSAAWRQRWCVMSQIMTGIPLPL